MSIVFKVEEVHESSADLALKMAEAITNVEIFLDESEKYHQHACDEEIKLKSLEDLYQRVIERDQMIEMGITPAPPKSRMDPVATYEAGALAKQVLMTKKRMTIYREHAIRAKTRADEERVRSKQLRVEIKRAVDREKKKKG